MVLMMTMLASFNSAVAEAVQKEVGGKDGLWFPSTTG
jgi:hypothetical protein